MSNEIYDQLGRLLKKVLQRYPKDAFDNHARLKGILLDHMDNAQREIRIVIDAIAEGIIDELLETPKSEQTMQVDRLVSRLENSRGIQENIARKIVQACAYSIGVGELPSSLNATATNTTGNALLTAQTETGLPTIAHQPEKPNPKTSVVKKSSPLLKIVLWSSAIVVISVLVLNLNRLQQALQPQKLTQSSEKRSSANNSKLKKNSIKEIKTRIHPDNTKRNTVIDKKLSSAKPKSVLRKMTVSKPKSVPQKKRVTNDESMPQKNTDKKIKLIAKITNSKPAVILTKLGPAVVQPEKGQYTWYDNSRKVWQIDVLDSNGNYRATSTIGSKLHVMRGKILINKIKFKIFNDENEQRSYGNGEIINNKHIDFIIYNMTSDIIHNGRFHIEHIPE